MIKQLTHTATKLTKSQQDIINTLIGISTLPKTKTKYGYSRRYKRHDKAIESLKLLGIIYKGEDSILQLRTISRQNDTAHQNFCNQIIAACK